MLVQTIYIAIVVVVLFNLYSSRFISIHTHAEQQFKSIHYYPQQQQQQQRIHNHSSKSHYHHCAIVITPLFGGTSNNNSNERRRRLALDWYRHVTVNSIRLAADRSNMAAVLVLLQNNESHADDVVPNVDNLGRVVTFFQFQDSSTAAAAGSSITTSDDGIKARAYSKIHKLVRERQCQFMSVVGLDADDMLLPAAFQNLERGWKEVMSNNNCSTTNNDNNNCHSSHALVSAVQHHEMPWLVLDPVISTAAAPAEDGGVFTCALEPPLPCAKGQEREFLPNAAGVAVTMTTETWLSQFRGDDCILAGNHKLLAKAVTKTMKEHNNITTHYQILGLNHSIWLQTPLSGHYRLKDRGRKNCSLAFLSKLLGEEGGEILWTNRWRIPRLTREEWESHALLRRNLTLYARFKKWNAQREWS